MINKKLKILSLFAGAGGMDLGFKNAGFDIVWANDFDPDSVKTYKRNFGDHIVLGDIEKIKTNQMPDNPDVVIGGFPCQGFSIANLGRSVDDSRNKLYKQMLRVIRAKKPKYFVAENVSGILTLGKGAGKIVQVVHANPGTYSTTLTYNSTSLTPCAQLAITAKSLNSHFLIKWSAVHGRSGNGRSQVLFAKAYTAGNNNYADGNYLFYDHYGLYHEATNWKGATSYSYYDNGSSLAVGASQTYYVFLGRIGSSGTDEANNQRLQIMEIAQ